MDKTTDTPNVTTIYKMLWRSMRVLRRFTLAELMGTVPVSVSREYVERFVGWMILFRHVDVAPGALQEDQEQSYLLIDGDTDRLNIPVEVLFVEMVPRLDTLVTGLFRFQSAWQKFCDGKVAPPEGKGFEDSRVCYDLVEAFRAFIGQTS